MERLILAELVDESATVIEVTAPSWVEEYLQAMGVFGRVTLSAPYSSRSALAEALREVMVTPIEREALRVFGRVTAIRQQRGQVRAVISLAEELQ